jgi:peroxiredoxin
MTRILLLAFLCCSAPAFGAGLAVGAPAPELTARLLDRVATVRLSSNVGKVTIVNFWATWCVPCREEMPAIQAYFDKHKSQGLEVLAISMDDPDALDRVRKAAAGFTFPVALKADADFRGFGRIWRMPSTFVIDRDGILRKNGHVGEPGVSLLSLEAEVTPLLDRR